DWSSDVCSSDLGEALWGATYQARYPCLDGFRSLGIFPQNEQWLSQCWGLLLHPARVRDQQPGMRQQDDEVVVVQRLHEVNPGASGESSPRCPNDCRIGMDREGEGNIFVLFNEAAQHAQISNHGTAKALAPMGGQGNTL